MSAVEAAEKAWAGTQPAEVAVVVDGVSRPHGVTKDGRLKHYLVKHEGAFVCVYCHPEVDA